MLHCNIFVWRGGRDGHKTRRRRRSRMAKESAQVGVFWDVTFRYGGQALSSGGTYFMRSAAPAFLAALSVLVIHAVPACAHGTEQGFVLLLPLDMYIATGISTVALTAIVIAIVPVARFRRIFSTVSFPSPRLPRQLPIALSLLSSAFLLFLIIVGFTGSTDPLANPLPLALWTVWWALLLFLQGILGDIWKWINPWTGLHTLIFGAADRSLLRIPDQLGHAPGIVLLLSFTVFALADIAPDYPPRLAAFAAAYWVITLVGMCVFGRDAWLERCECFTMLFRLFATVAPLRCAAGRCRCGIPGWQIVSATPVAGSLAVFALVALATGSFDGLNETFWWLALIGVNPLEFPGRSAVAGPTLAGIAAAAVLLCAVFASCVWMGQQLARQNGGGESGAGFRTAFNRLALTVLPIALGYHFAHYLTSFLVDGQYAYAAVSDPLTAGADLLGLGDFHVTTGFFYEMGTVRLILVTQATMIVIGHVIAVLTAHSIALDLFRQPRRAALSQIPMAVFMVLYTLFSLWLLASPRGA